MINFKANLDTLSAILLKEAHFYKSCRPLACDFAEYLIHLQSLWFLNHEMFRGTEWPFSQNCFVISPGFLYHLIRHDSVRLQSRPLRQILLFLGTNSLTVYKLQTAQVFFKYFACFSRTPIYLF